MLTSLCSRGPRWGISRLQSPIFNNRFTVTAYCIGIVCSNQPHNPSLPDHVDLGSFTGRLTSRVGPMSSYYPSTPEMCSLSTYKRGFLFWRAERHLLALS
jgi:hypothetical protein